MTTRRIDVTEFAPLGAIDDAPPVLKWIPIDQLIIDDRYQRQIERTGRSNILKIAKSFDWAKFSPLMVSERGRDLYAIIDGQHRTHAAALRGITEVPAFVSSLSLQQEAASFSWINGAVTALTQNQIFRAALAAFEPWAVQCDAVVARAGCRLMQFNKSGADKRPGEVFCVGLVRGFVESGNSVYLSAVLQGIRHSSAADRVDHYASFGLSALVPSAAHCGCSNPNSIAAFLNANSLDKIARSVERVKERPEYAGQSFKALMADSVKVILKAFLDKDTVQ